MQKIWLVKRVGGYWVSSQHQPPACVCLELLVRWTPSSFFVQTGGPPLQIRSCSRCFCPEGLLRTLYYCPCLLMFNSSDTIMKCLYLQAMGHSWHTWNFGVLQGFPGSHWRHAWILSSVTKKRLTLAVVLWLSPHISPHTYPKRPSPGHLVLPAVNTEQTSQHSLLEQTNVSRFV